MNFDINLIAMVGGVISNMVLGMIWYSPSVFGNIWMESIGKKPNEIDKKSVGKMYTFTMVAALITSIVVGVMIKSLGIVEMSAGITFAIVAWLGLSAATALPSYLFEGREMKTFAIYTGYQLISFILMAILHVLIK
ncbi:MAG: DUF1761 domain-containing protein [Candidatus Bilamarchaeum sp.]|jgi:Zn-dependent protease